MISLLLKESSRSGTIYQTGAKVEMRTERDFLFCFSTLLNIHVRAHVYTFKGTDTEKKEKGNGPRIFTSSVAGL